MIYDYRNDLIKLIEHTQNTDDSLIQTLYCLQIISTTLLNGQYLQHPEKLLPNLLNTENKQSTKPAPKPKPTAIFDEPGQVIKYLRNKAKLSQQQLSQQLGVSPSHISNIERGHKHLTPELTEKLYDIFKIDEAQFNQHLKAQAVIPTPTETKTQPATTTKPEPKPAVKSDSPIRYIKKASRTKIPVSDTYVSDQTLVKVATQKRSLKAHEYVARRNLNNVSLLDLHGNQVDILSESQIHDQNISSGDIVTAVYRYGQYDFQHVTHQHLDLKALRIEELQYGQVQENARGKLYIDQDIYGHPITNYNPDLSTYEISNRIANAFNILNGSIVTLAWYQQNPSTVKIRWVHTTDPRDEVKPTLTKSPSKSSTKSTKKEKTNPSQPFQPDLDYDLHHQVVNVIIGDCNREQEIKNLIEAHSGVPEVTDAFIHQDTNKVLEDALSQSDIAVMVQNLNKHSTSKALSLVVKSQNLKFAISNSAGLQAIERAIFRADRGLPAYEPTGNSINYPIKTTKMA